MRFEPKSLIRIPDIKVLEEIQRVVKENGGIVPTTPEFSRLAKISIATIRDRFGSYAAAMERAGFVYEPSNAKYTFENVVADLRKIFEHTKGSRFSFKFYKQYGGLYALATIMSSLGMQRWSEVMVVIGADEQLSVARTGKSIRGERRREDLSDNDLLNEIGRLWRKKGRRPTSTEFKRESEIDGEAYRLRFGSWANAIERYCHNIGINFQHKSGTHVTKEMLIKELTKVFGKRPGDLITYKMYRERGGTYSKGPFFVHFGNWMNAAKFIGGTSGSERRYSIDQLFDEMQRLWEFLGQQPTWREMSMQGNISPKVYERVFGGWKKSVNAFCDDRNGFLDSLSTEAVAPDISMICDNNISLNNTKHTFYATKIGQTKHLSSLDERSSSIVRFHPRYPSPRIRFKIFVRDKFSCQHCGRTHKNDGVKIVIDHIFPYSKGGKTVLENLQLLCEECNMGKYNEIIEGA